MNLVTLCTFKIFNDDIVFVETLTSLVLAIMKLEGSIVFAFEEKFPDTKNRLIDKESYFFSKISLETFAGS